MKIEVTQRGKYLSVEIQEGSTTIDLGLLSESERNDIARTMLMAVVAMGPSYSSECEDWFKDLAFQCGMLCNGRG